MEKAQIIIVAVNTIDIFFRLLAFFIFARILMSWIAPHSRGKLAEFIISTTEPILSIFYRFNLKIGLLDLTPLVALITLNIAHDLLIKLIMGFQ